MKKKRILIAVGGTGGHIYPAVTLAKQLLTQHPNVEVLFVGGGLGGNRYFSQSSFPYKEIPCGTLSPSKPLKSLHNLWKIARGIKQSHRILKDFSPNLVIGFGSFYSLPTLLATKLRKIPFLLHEANRIPGKVNRLLSRYALLTGVHFSDATKLLKGTVRTIPLPLREGYRHGTVSKESALNYFQLTNALPTVLIFGGSQGAQAINSLAGEAIVMASRFESLQVIHFTGNTASARQLQSKYAQHAIHACVKEFETRMDLAWQAADLVISRSGASTCAEALEFEVPGILIPYPHATDNHQDSNADFMVHEVGGAIKCREADLSADRLASEIKKLIQSHQDGLKSLKKSLHSYKNKSQPADLCQIVAHILLAQGHS